MRTAEYPGHFVSKRSEQPNQEAEMGGISVLEQLLCFPASESNKKETSIHNQIPKENGKGPFLHQVAAWLQPS